MLFREKKEAVRGAVAVAPLAEAVVAPGEVDVQGAVVPGVSGEKIKCQMTSEK